MKLKWNPKYVSPPKEESKYLITDQYGNIDIAHWHDRNYLGEYGKGEFRWYAGQYQEVVAWMPLPEPYDTRLDKILDLIEDMSDEEIPRQTYEKIWEIVNEDD